jgi:nitrile hydratase
MTDIHDMGGMSGFGSVVMEKDEPVFHEDWEARAYALATSWYPWGRYKSFGSFRHHLEKIPAQDYLSMSYYERWFLVNEQKALELEIVSEKELEDGKADPNRRIPLLEPPPDSNLGSGRLDLNLEAKFHVGQLVRAKEIKSSGHNRLPGYVRSKLGVVTKKTGVYALQDTDEKDEQPYDDPQHVYTVRFSSRELWGEKGRDLDFVYVDIWESYLDPS